MIFCSKQNKKIYENINLFLGTIKSTFDELLIACRYHLDGDIDRFEETLNSVLSLESKADDLRRQIETKLYQRSLLPELRKDILLTVNRLDALPDQAELVVKTISTLSLAPVDFLRDDELELVQLCVDTVLLVIEMTEDVFNKNVGTKVLISQIDQNESRGDFLESKMIKALFNSSCTDFQKILLREKIQTIGKILDLCQSVSDFISITSIKRKV